MNADSLNSLAIDQSFFTDWIKGENWIKSRFGVGLNMTLGLLTKIVSGLVLRSAFLAGMGVASAIDLVAVAVQKGTSFLKGIAELAIRLVREVAKVFGMATDESRLFLSQLLEKMKNHLKKTRIWR